MSSELKNRVQSDLNEARKQRDRARTLVLSTLLSELKNREMDDGESFDDAAAVQVVSKAIKQRKDAAEQMRAAGRDELAQVEEDQSAVLQGYLPEGLAEGDVRQMIRSIVEGGADNMGAVMGQLMPRIRGRFDGKDANRIVQEELGG